MTTISSDLEIVGFAAMVLIGGWFRGLWMFPRLTKGLRWILGDQEDAIEVFPFL